ncbi:MAG: hypothetical protein IJY36_08235 [Coprobacter sp.]|nr:hypothetical protein [Coprobacter sp.]
MKKFLLLFVLVLGAISLSNGQNLIYSQRSSDDCLVLPKYLSAENKTTPYTYRADGSSVIYTLFNENFEIDREFTIQTNVQPEGYQIWERNENREWEIVDQWESNPLSIQVEEAIYYNYDNGLNLEDQYLYMTQNLFNNDDKYEVFRYITEPIIDTTILEYDASGEIHKYRIDKDNEIKGMEIISEEGAIIATLSISAVPDRWEVWIINDKKYLFASEVYIDERYYNYIYSLDSETGAVQQVANTASAMKVFPTLASTSDVVTVETAASDDVRRLVISNMAGQVVSVQPVPAGEVSMRIDTRRLRRGVYNFTLESNGKVVDNGKLVIK